LARWRSYSKPTNALGVMLNTFDIMTHRQANLHSANADILIEPHLEQFSASDFKKAAELMAAGYRAACLALPEINRVLHPSPVTKAPGFWQRLWQWIKTNL
jgi:predicted acylesterase/phospholipase RssA